MRDNTTATVDVGENNDNSEGNVEKTEIEMESRSLFVSILVTLGLIFGPITLIFAIFIPSWFEWLPNAILIFSSIFILFIFAAIIANRE